MHVIVHLSYRRIRRYLVWRLKRLEARDFSHVRIEFLIHDDSIIGRDSDGSLNEDYCKWCYADGTYTYSDMDELIDVCVRNMVSENFTEEQARSYMKELLPNWFSIKKGKLP